MCIDYEIGCLLAVAQLFSIVTTIVINLSASCGVHRMCLAANIRIIERVRR